MAADPKDRIAKAREALAELDVMVSSERWADAEEQTRYVKALLTQCGAVCGSRIPRKPLAERTKFHRGYERPEDE
jgi:hypothetical protein